jgi:hypothetical protein
VEQFWLWLVGFRSIRPADLACVCTPRFIANDTQAPLVQPAPERTPQDKLTSKKPLRNRVVRFCHAGLHLSVTNKPRFKCSEIAVGCGLFWYSDYSRYSPSPLAG